MPRMCFALDLIDDAALIDAYERAHAPGAAWPEVTAGIRAAGYETMDIWRAGDRMFMIAEVADDWPRPVPADLAEVDSRWQAEMDRFCRRLAIARPGEKWVPMTQIFSLDAQ